MSTVPSREEALFSDALAQPPAERGAFVDHACGGNVQLRERILTLLAAHNEAESLLLPAATSMPDGWHEEQAGDMIDHYRLIEKTGEGGCGVVWIAEQAQPVRRRVALKIIKLGMDTKAVIARFEAERQALAMMDHPNIAKVFDAKRLCFRMHSRSRRRSALRFRPARACTLAHRQRPAVLRS